MTSLTLNNYARDIALSDGFSIVETSLSTEEELAIVESLLQELAIEVSRLGVGDYSQHNAQDKRLLLDSALTIASPKTLSLTGIERLNSLLQNEMRRRALVGASTLLNKPYYSIGSTRIVLWQGDITTLKVDAIVNAANNQLLGCFLPQHKCIDNVIHSRAGVQLRNDCQTIMQKQQQLEPTGAAKVTRAYNLPSNYVIHTVGPIVQGRVTEEHRTLLTSCYDSIMDISKELEDIRSVAFCAISTGVFGYPIEQAAPVAIQAVNTWLAENPDQLDVVIFNVFSDEDYRVYRSTLDTLKQS